MDSLDEACAALASHLRERLPELRGAVATRVYSISDPYEVADAAFLEGLNAAIPAAIEYRIAELEGPVARYAGPALLTLVFRDVLSSAAPREHRDRVRGDAARFPRLLIRG